MQFISRFSDPTLGLLRVAAGLLFMQHGVQKLFGWLGGMGEPGATAELFSLIGLAGVLEVVGGLLIALGFFTSPVALVLAAEMVVAYLMAHLPGGFFPIQNGGELAALYAFIFLFLAANGPGPFSVDRTMARDVPAARERESDEVLEAVH